MKVSSSSSDEARGKTPDVILERHSTVAHVDELFSRPYRLQGATVELMVNKLRIKDSVTAAEGYHDSVCTMAREPYPAIEGMRNVQRLLKSKKSVNRQGQCR